jgi:hypothetical protein
MMGFAARLVNIPPVDFIDAVRAKYPDLYPGGVYFWFPTGWTAIVEHMSAALVGKRVAIRRVLEKYGLLIVEHDANATDPEAIAVLQAATDASEVTCAQCGAPGVMRETGDGFVLMRCDEHTDGAEPISECYAVEIAAAGRRIAEREA